MEKYKISSLTSIRELREKHLLQYIDLPVAGVPDRAPKMTHEPVSMVHVDRIFTVNGRAKLGSEPKTSDRLLTFEELNQNSGFVLFETSLPKLTRDPSQLTVEGLRDRAQIYVDEVFKFIWIVSIQTSNFNKFVVLRWNPLQRKRHKNATNISRMGQQIIDLR